MELRLVGLSSYHIFALVHSELSRLRISPANPFWVVLVDNETKGRLENWRKKQSIPLLLAEAPEPESGKREPELPTWDAVKDHCDSVVSVIQQAFPSVNVDWAVNARAKARDRESLDIDFGFTGHNVTIPNELMLMSVGGSFKGTQEPLVGEDSKYISRILQVADEAAIVRHAVPAGNVTSSVPLMPTVILAAPGIYRHASRFRPGKGKSKSPALRMLRKLQQRKTYSLQFDDEAEARELMKDEEGRQLLQIRTMEQCALTDALSIRSASYLCPVLPLSPAVNHTQPALVRLADCLRGNKPSPQKVSRLYAELTTALSEAVPSEFINRIDMPHPSIKLVSDAPLEFLPIRDLPLVLRHVVSRIPITPGNQAYQELTPHDQIEISPEQFQETLVIRSFKGDDPLRNDLKNAIDTYSLSDGSELPVRFVDVRNEKELECAFSSYDGALVIFDGHGYHNRQEDIGQLQLTDESVNLWELRARVRVPPVAFLCACDTHAFDRSHITPGTGLLSCGCRAIIATALPVQSQIAAIFAARLLFRLYEYLPHVTNDQRKMTRWDNVFSMTQRMMYVSEWIFAIPSKRSRDNSWRQQVMTSATPIIHTEYNWFEKVRENIAQCSGYSVEEVERLRMEKLAFPETFKYLHIGNPESVIIRPKDWEPEETIGTGENPAGT